MDGMANLDRYLSQSDEDWLADLHAMHGDDLEDIPTDTMSQVAAVLATIFTKQELEILQAIMREQPDSEKDIIIIKLVGFIKGYVLSNMEVDYASNAE